jgi:signal transduction histidine kinase
MDNNLKKLESIGTLAHDLNNILSPILGYTELVLEEVDPQSLAAKNLNQVYKVANRARDLVQQILDISRQGDE